MSWLRLFGSWTSARTWLPPRTLTFTWACRWVAFSDMFLIQPVMESRWIPQNIIKVELDWTIGTIKNSRLGGYHCTEILNVQKIDFIPEVPAEWGSVVFCPGLPLNRFLHVFSHNLPVFEKQVKKSEPAPTIVAHSLPACDILFCDPGSWWKLSKMFFKFKHSMPRSILPLLCLRR